MSPKAMTGCRDMLESLSSQGELLTISAEVDPTLEVAAIAKALDCGPALLFNNVKGYPSHRIVSNVFSTVERMNALFATRSIQELKRRYIDGVRNPISPRLVNEGPCQEVVLTKNLDVLGTLPLLKHTATDPGRILGGGVVLLRAQDMGSCISYKRMHFRAKDWSSLAFIPGSHFEHWVLEYRKRGAKMPVTVNISPSPAVEFVAGSGSIPMAVPAGSDELGIAGAMQDVPVEICRAVSVDTMSIANSEWVIEGYVDTGKVVWESEQAEKQPEAPAPFFPEFHGYQGTARATYQFCVTGITHRKDSPVFYAPLAHSYEANYIQALPVHAALKDLLDRRWPGLVADVNSLPGMKLSAVVIRLRITRKRDEDQIKDMVYAAWAASGLIQTVILVDDDIDIYNADDVIWALNTRVKNASDIVLAPRGSKIGFLKNDIPGPPIRNWRVGIDATVPAERRVDFARGEFLEVDLSRWLTSEQIARIRAAQPEYARVLAGKRT